ncbi:MAG: ArnT family glycosyltransferase [Erythrobacter sp.]
MKMEPISAAESGERFRSRGDALSVVLLLTACALVVRLPYLGDANADIDEQLYSLIGNAMLDGKLPFVDLWDRKPFGLFLLYALAHAIGGPSPLAYQLFATGFAVLGALLTRQLAMTLVDRTTAMGAAVLFVILMAIYGPHSGQTEIFHVPAMLAMALLVRDPEHPQAIGRALAAMLIGGLALQVKYTVLPQCAFFGLWALWGQFRQHGSVIRTVRLGAGFAALGLLPSGLVGLFYLAIGEWDAFWFANFVSFFDRLPSPTGRLVTGDALFLFPLAALVALGGYAALRLRVAMDKRSYAFFTAWLLASLATVFLPSTVYAYYYAALVPAAILLAMPFLDRRGPLRFGPLAVVIALFFSLLYYGTRIDATQRSRTGMAQLAETIAPLVDDKSRCLWVFDGPTALYRETGSCLPTRFIYPDHLNNALERDSLGIRQIDEVRRILALRPPVIVTADIPFTAQNEDVKALVMQTVRTDYELVLRAPIHARTISVWAHRDASRVDD